MSTLKALRISKKLTQKQACELLGVSLRSYKEYENDEAKVNTLKYRSMVNELEKYTALDEEHGILTMDEIKRACRKVLDEYSVKYCILFGSYAKGTPTETSDVDLLISTPVTGIMFYDLIESVREELKKKVDILSREQLHNNPELINEILKDGIKIYG